MLIHKVLTSMFISAVLCVLVASVALGRMPTTSASSLLPCVLLVDDDQDGPDVRVYYTSALDELGATYDVWDVATQGDPSADDLVDYNTVIWFTGYPRSDTFTSANETAVAAYLDAEGSFFLSSEDYLYDRGATSFGQGRLRIGSYTNDVNRMALEGAGLPPGGELGPYNLVPPAGWPGQLYTDDVVRWGAWGVYSPFRWEGASETNSTSYRCSSTDYRTVFLAWPFEGLANLADRVEVMGAIIDWFGGCEIPPTETPTPTSTPTSTPITTPTPTSTPVLSHHHVYLPLILKWRRG